MFIIVFIFYDNQPSVLWLTVFFVIWCDALFFSILVCEFRILEDKCIKCKVRCVSHWVDRVHFLLLILKRSGIILHEITNLTSRCKCRAVYLVENKLTLNPPTMPNLYTRKIDVVQKYRTCPITIWGWRLLLLYTVIYILRFYTFR